MRSSTVATLAVLAAASPALSAPTSISDGTYARELLSRQSSTQARDESGAVRIGIPRPSGIARLPFFGLGPELPPQISQTPQSRELAALLAREDVTDESGAINWGKVIGIIPKVVSGAEHLFGGDSAPSPQPSQAPQRRELEELLAREDVTDESGAINWGKVLGIIPKVVDGAEKLFGGGNPPPPQQSQAPQRREFEELLARADVDQSGAINWTKVLGIIPKVIGGAEKVFGGGSAPPPQQSQAPQRRDVEEIVARHFVDTLVTRDDVDESGAINWGSIIPKVVGFASHLFGGGSAPPQPSQPAQRRSFDELSSRDESGALFIPHFRDHGPALLPTSLPIFAPNPPQATQQPQRRELEELLTREIVDALIARDDVTDESGAINLKGLFNTIPKIVNGIDNFFGGGSSDPQPSQPAQRRDESGALNLPPFRIGVPIWRGHGPVVLPTPLPTPPPPQPSQAAQRRDESGAINWGSILSHLPLPAIDRRDLEDLVLREVTSQLSGTPQLRYTNAGFRPGFDFRPIGPNRGSFRGRPHHHAGTPSTVAFGAPTLTPSSASAPVPTPTDAVSHGADANANANANANGNANAKANANANANANASASLSAPTSASATSSAAPQNTARSLNELD